MSEETQACAVCSIQGVRHTYNAGSYVYYCPRCGDFLLSADAFDMLRSKMETKEANLYASALSHRIRRTFDNQRKMVALLWDDIHTFDFHRYILSPVQQLGLLILWLGGQQMLKSGFSREDGVTLAARIGCRIGNSESDLRWLINEAMPRGLYQSIGVPNRIVEVTQPIELRLTMKGWRQYEHLSRKGVGGRNAFMAMKFGDDELDRIFETCFKPAAKRAGLALNKMTDLQKAGIIDNQIRAQIRSSKLVIADLTHDNNGAYFEAGFAEGLGVSVIYTCRKDKFKIESTHFDTNHAVTIAWDPLHLDASEKELTATIRNTLPDIAVMTDIAAI